MRKLVILLILFISLSVASDIISLRMFEDMYNVMTASSDHFIYIYKKEMSDILPEIANIAEGVYDTLSKSMRTKMTTKVNLLITDQSDVPNGSSSPLLNPMVNIYLANPDPTFISKHEEWIEYVLTHELTHALHLSSTRPSCLAQTGNSFFYFPNVMYPMYFLEGYAVYNESTLKRGRMKETNYEAFLRTMFIDSFIQPIGNASSYFNREFPYGTLPYLYGSYLFDKYKEKYDAPISTLTQLDFCSLLPFSVLFPDFFLYIRMGAYPSDVLEEVYSDVKVKIDKLKNEMLFNERKKVSSFGFDNSLPLLYENKLYYIKSFPHREKRMVERFNDKERELFRVPYSTSFTVRDNKIYIDILDIYDNTNLFFDIYIYDISSNRYEKLKSTRRGFGADALGDTLLFIRNNLNEEKIIVYSLSKRSAVDSFSVDENFKYYSISIKSFSEILISCYREGGYTDIILYDLNSKEHRFLTSDIASDYAAKWSEEKNGFYFISDRSGVNAVYFYDLNQNTIQKVYNSIYNVSSFSVDEENEKIYVQDISKYGDDIYVSDILYQEIESIELKELVKPASFRKSNIKLNENGNYIFPRFSGPGAYGFLPIYFLSEDTISLHHYFALPFVTLNSDISQSFTVIASSFPLIEVKESVDVSTLDYPTYINLTSSHFKNDIGLMLTFKRDSLNDEYEGLKRYLPNEYQISLSTNFTKSKPFTYSYLTPSISYKKFSYFTGEEIHPFTAKGVTLEGEISNYESSILSITPSQGFSFSSESYLSKLEGDSSILDFGIKLVYTFYVSPVWDFNLFFNTNVYYSRTRVFTNSSLMSFLNDSMPSLTFTASEDGFTSNSYINDFSYLKVGLVKPLLFINRGIPIEFIASLPIRFDYISFSASQIVGYNVAERRTEMVSKVSLNLSINLSILSIYPGLALTYNEVSKNFDFGITSNIK